jgi:hypothetical protein
MLKMITLSKTNCRDLDSGVADLIRSFRRLRQRRLWKDHVDGGAVVIEIKGNPGFWHPHLHILCWSRWLPWLQLHAAWKSVSDGLGCYIQNVGQDTAIRYVTKYVTKTDLPDRDQQAVGKVLIRYRLFQRFGSWHHIFIPKLKSDYPCPNCGESDWICDWQLDRIARYD